MEHCPLFQQVDHKEGLAQCFAGLAAIENASGRPERAARLLGTIEALRETLQAPLTRAEHAELDEVRQEVLGKLGVSTFEMLWLEGRVMPLADAIANALSEPLEISPSSVELYITAFGHASVLRAGRPLADADWRYAKARELFFFLLTQPRATKEQLGLALYPEVSPSQLRTRLHRVLHCARQTLGRNDWILFENDEYAFNLGRAYWFDVEQFEQRVRAARAALAAAPPDVPLAIRQLHDAAPLYAGDFLPELDADWILFRREELRRKALEALLELGSLLVAEARPAEAVPVYQRLLALDSYLEVAHRELMRSYARLGDAGQARQHFRQLSDLLRKELGNEPSPETLRLDEQIRAGRGV